MSVRKIGILSPSGTGNLGDEATVAVLIEEIRSRYPHAEIYGLTVNPDDTRKRHGIAAYPARNKACIQGPVATGNGWTDTTDIQGTHLIKTVLKKIPFLYAVLKALQAVPRLLANSIAELGFLAKSFGLMRGTNLLIVAGSGQLCDNFSGAWGFPYSLVKWSVIARLCGARLAYLSCGAGPIDSWLSRIFIKVGLRLAQYRSFRDAGSSRLVEKIGVSGTNPVFPDLVFSTKFNGNESSARKSRIVAINPFPHCDQRYWTVDEPEAYSSYVTRLASVASWLIKNNYTVLFFPTQIRADVLVIEDVKRILMKDPALDLEQHLVVKAISTVDDLVAQLATADMVVASRFHGVLISFLLNKPVLALSHHPKVDNLMRDMGQSDFLLDIGTFDSKTVASRLEALESRSQLIKQQIRFNVATCRRKLESQYRDVFCPMDSPVSAGVERLNPATTKRRFQ